MVKKRFSKIPLLWQLQRLLQHASDWYWKRTCWVQSLKTAIPLSGYPCHILVVYGAVTLVLINKLDPGQSLIRLWQDSPFPSFLILDKHMIALPCLILAECFSEYGILTYELRCLHSRSVGALLTSIKVKRWLMRWCECLLESRGIPTDFFLLHYIITNRTKMRCGGVGGLLPLCSIFFFSFWRCGDSCRKISRSSLYLRCKLCKSN